MSRRLSHASPTPESLLRGLGHAALLRRIIDDPAATSLAWPGANPAFAARGVAEQLTLFATNPLAGAFLEDGSTGRATFDSSAFVVRRLAGSGSARQIGRFLNETHYAGGAGMQAVAAFGLFHTPTDELVGVCTFGRESNPKWAHHTFKPLEEDLVLRSRGDLSEAAFRNRLVAESEYLVLTRLALRPPAATRAPLGRGAATWFTARAALWIEMRNRSLWAAITAAERGEHVSPAARRLIAEARLEESGKGLGFCKAIATAADPWEGHIGHVYQVLGFHYLGRSNNGAWRLESEGERSGQRISARTIEKAREPSSVGHDTAVLRLIWEGGTGRVRVISGERVIHEDDGQWVRSTEDEGLGVARAIGGAWRSYTAAMRLRHGGTVRFETEHFGGGALRRRFPPKHNYLLPLGSTYWQHVIERRCKHLSARLRAEDRAWEASGWGPRPDRRRDFYPVAVDPAEVRPERGILAGAF